MTLMFTRDALPGRVVFGPGAARTLPEELSTLKVSRVLLITTERAAPLAKDLAGPIAGMFTDVRQHVPALVAEAALRAAEQTSADCLLAVGGGSAIGTAKAVALRTALPIVAVPTTYAGSEMTPVWGRTDGAEKHTGRSPNVLPKLVVYDPDLTATLPPEVAAASGMNALAHAVAAHTADPVTVLIAKEAVRVLKTALPTQNPVASLYGAYLAATAFAVAGGGPHHKLCHALGGAYDLPHAQTHAVLLPYTAQGTVNGLRELAERLGAPTSLQEIGMTPESLAEAMERLPQHRALLANAYEGRWP